MPVSCLNATLSASLYWLTRSVASAATLGPSAVTRGTTPRSGKFGTRTVFAPAAYNVRDVVGPGEHDVEGIRVGAGPEAGGERGPLRIEGPGEGGARIDLIP